jgi:hypothetical protein
MVFLIHALHTKFKDKDNKTHLCRTSNLQFEYLRTQLFDRHMAVAFKFWQRSSAT